MADGVSQGLGTLDGSGGGVRTGTFPAHSTTPCPTSLTTVQFTSVEFILPTVTLGVLNIVVIIGNALVIGAVFTSAKLRTTTNGFVCSLAVADLLVGLMVLPFSNANEVLRYWVFGPIWCSVWLAVDVWLCTASILNLVAISFDRYIAISRPFKYHSLLSPKRGKFLVGFVWILSFVICFPPLIGWNEQGKGLGNRFRRPGSEGPGGKVVHSGSNGSDAENATNVTEDGGWSGSGNDGVMSLESSGSGAEAVALGFEASAENLYIVSNVRRYAVENLTSMYTARNMSLKHPQHGGGLTESCDLRFPECGLTSDPGYIVYSALGSFWIPMIIMCAFYWKIYRTAVKSTAALKHGMLTTKTGTELSSSGNSESVTLRVHRGGGGGGMRASENGSKRRSGPPGTYSKCHYRSSYTGRDLTLADTSDTVFMNTAPSSSSGCSSTRNKRYRDPKIIGRKTAKHNNVRLGSTGPQPDFPLLGKHPDDSGDYFKLKIKPKKRPKSSASSSGHSRQQAGRGERPLMDSLTDNEELEPLSNGGVSPVAEQHETRTMAFLRKSRRKNIKLELQRLNKEKKAAKTVGVIVGCFVMCWLPFFTVYLLGACCPSCTPPLVFSIFFWLGYCNSAINPCVYALFSRDFRCAFKKLLQCNCRVEPRHNKHQLGFVSKLHSFRMQASSRSNESNSD